MGSIPDYAAAIEALAASEAVVVHLEAENERLQTALREIATECSTFPLKNGVAFRCESIARAALSWKGET